MRASCCTVLILLWAAFSGGAIRTKSLGGAEAGAKVRLRVGEAPGCVAVADLNNDRVPDIVVTNERDSSATILLGKGKGTFAEAFGSPVPAGHGVNDVAIGDVNNDGNPDLLFANHDRQYLTLLLGDGKGGFYPHPRSPFPVEVAPHTHGVALGDFNGDGRLDLVTDSWGNNQLEVLFGDSVKGFRTPGTFLHVGPHPYQRVRTADVNNDGHPDIVTTNLDGDNATVLLSDGRGRFREAPGSPFPCGDAPFGVAVGDVNGDGRADLAIIDSPASTAGRRGVNGLTILLGDGTGRFSAMHGSPYPAGRVPNQVAIGDLDGDGVNDIVVSDNGGDAVSLFFMNRGGSVRSSSTTNVGHHPKGVAVADLDGDGKGEILVCNNLDNDILIIFGK